MTITTYSTRSNAGRAARAALNAQGVKEPLSGVHFRIEPAGSAFIVTFIDQATGKTTPFEASAAELEAQAPRAAIKAAKAPPELDPAFTAPKTRGAQLAAKARAAEGKRDVPKGKAARGEAAAQAALESAKAGKLPTPPAFGGASGAPYQTRLDKIVALAKAKDVAGLRAFNVSTTVANSRIVQMAKYRDLCVVALEAKGGA